MPQHTSRTLYGYWRSSAAYRVRIALALKGLEYVQESIDLRTGVQRSQTFNSLNPQSLVPHLVDGDIGLSQSLAIIEYLDERYPEPRLIPQEIVLRARVRAMALTIACEIHPLNNLRVLKYLEHSLGLDQQAVNGWARKWIEEGFAALEASARDSASPYLACSEVTVADVCLVPQMYNARRVETDLAPFPTLLEIERRLLALPAFQKARPEAQPDAPAR
jgi:maleylacetoacetate isomerase/maleylpyruvate isomerase